MSQVSPSHDPQVANPQELDRLLRLNRFLNQECLDRLGLKPGERVLEVGSGLGLFARGMARTVGGTPPVVCVEYNEGRIYRSLELAASDGEESLIDMRQGDLYSLPLREEEFGTFDLVHCRFVMSRVSHPQRAIETLMPALRPGGRMVLMDDDNDLLRLWPSMPAVDELWRALVRGVVDRGRDPFVGRKLSSMMQVAGLQLSRNGCLFGGGNAGTDGWEFVTDNIIDVLRAARESILASTAITGELFDEVLGTLVTWSQRPDSALWYPICWAEGIRPDS
ncbi:MAG: methyltransferase domain-containing protein [Planctomycetota bacterium]|nr:methyltransferase domain-containing protein [Planctomycetota bacterium]